MVISLEEQNASGDINSWQCDASGGIVGCGDCLYASCREGFERGGGRIIR